MDHPELLPCPFCGSTAHIDYNTDHDFPRVVECDNDECEAMGPWCQRGQDRKQAMAYIVKGWNSRISVDRALADLADKAAEQRAEPKL